MTATKEDMAPVVYSSLRTQPDAFEVQNVKDPMTRQKSSTDGKTWLTLSNIYMTRSSGQGAWTAVNILLTLSNVSQGKVK